MREITTTTTENPSVEKQRAFQQIHENSTSTFCLTCYKIDGLFVFQFICSIIEIQRLATQKKGRTQSAAYSFSFLHVRCVAFCFCLFSLLSVFCRFAAQAESVRSLGCSLRARFGIFIYFDFYFAQFSDFSAHVHKQYRTKHL